MQRLEVRGRLMMVIQRYAESEPDGRIQTADGDDAICIDLLNVLPLVEAEFGIAIDEETVAEIETIDDLLAAVESRLRGTGHVPAGSVGLE